jgi:hypothetical protein
MLIVFGPDASPASSTVDETPHSCEFVDSIDAYATRQMEPGVRAAFERHLIHCSPCRRAVYLGRISNPFNYHNRSVGSPCATPMRRKP